MDLKDFLAIAGKPGLFKNVGASKNGVIVESIPDGKRTTAFAHERISSLTEISVFTTGEDVPLLDIFRKTYEICEGKKAIEPTEGAKELTSFMEKVLPDYDRDRVYNSDIKKIVGWYNLLVSNNLLDFTDVEEDTDTNSEPSETEASESSNNEAPDAKE